MAQKGFFRRLISGIGHAIREAFSEEPPRDEHPTVPAPPKESPKRRARVPAKPRGKMPEARPGEGIFEYRERLQEDATRQVFTWARQGYFSTYHAGRIRHNLGNAEFHDLGEFFTMSVEDYRAAARRKPAIFGYK